MKTLLKTLVTVSIATFALSSAVLAEDTRTPVYPEGSNPIAPYSPGIKLANGMLFVSGQIAYVKGAIPDKAKTDITEQTKIFMENLRTVLNEAGYDFDDAVRANVYLTNMDNYGAFNKVSVNTGVKVNHLLPVSPSKLLNYLEVKPGASTLVEVSMVAVK